MSDPYDKLKLYIAAPFERRDEALALKEVLEKYDIEVTSTWLTPHDDLSMNVLQASENKHRECQKRALKDVDDIGEANVFVLMKPKAWHRQPTTGAHHGEMLLAWYMGKECFIFGDRENVFHYLPGVEVVSGTSELLRALHIPETCFIPGETPPDEDAHCDCFKGCPRCED